MENAFLASSSVLAAEMKFEDLEDNGKCVPRQLIGPGGRNGWAIELATNAYIHHVLVLSDSPVVIQNLEQQSL